MKATSVKKRKVKAVEDVLTELEKVFKFKVLKTIWKESKENLMFLTECDSGNSAQFSICKIDDFDNIDFLNGMIFTLSLFAGGDLSTIENNNIINSNAYKAIIKLKGEDENEDNIEQ